MKKKSESVCYYPHSTNGVKPILSVKKCFDIIKSEEENQKYTLKMGVKFSKRYEDNTLGGNDIFIKNEVAFDKIIILEWE